MSIQHHVMLICSSTREIPRAVETAVETARGEGGRLSACFVLDTALVRATRRRLDRSGFGETLSDDADSALLAEYRARGTALLDTVATVAGDAGVACEPHFAEGPFVDTCLRLVADDAPDRIYLSRKRRSQYARALFDGPTDDLSRQLPCPVDVLDDD